MEFSQIDLYEFLTESELQHYYNAVKNELKITSAAQFKFASDEDLKHIGLSRPEIRRLRKFYEKQFPHGYFSKIKRLLQAPTIIVKRDDGNAAIPQPSGLQNDSKTMSSTKDANTPSKVPNNKHIIPTDSITVNKQLGTGEFGIVQQGVWTNGNDRIQVAIKCLCRERMQTNPMEFLKEAAIMHSIEHENIVRLYGVVLATDSLMLVTELAHLRSLLECLKDSGLRVSFLTIPTLCEFAMQICNGMRYLENKRLIHRDLAARNILVFSKNKVKISDFGLSRALGAGKDYYKTNFNVNLKLPIAWCAPECINYLRFTNASDVWAYGVCLWEMFSYGFQPWAALTGLQILEAIDAPNYQRLEQPDCCPHEYYMLMMKCWQDDPINRPKFSDIYEILPDMKPEQLKTVVHCLESKKDHLLYYQGDILTVLDRNTGTPFWKGVLVSGKTGFFNPSNTVAFLEGLPSSNRDSFCRTNERCSKRKLRTEMISKPQNDFKHTGHVGIDGASFGDIAFLGNSQSYNHVPRQIVTPYKPSEDIEQTPLLLPPTPTSPDSLQTASAYFPEGANNTSMNPLFIRSSENTPKHFSVTAQASFEFLGQQSSKMKAGVTAFTNPFAKKTDDQSFAIQNNNYGIESKSFTNTHPSLLAETEMIDSESHWGGTIAAKNNGNELHEYHEISDDEITADKLDFGPSLLDEINSMFGSISASNSQPKSLDFDQNNIKNEVTEFTSKLVRKNSTDDSNSSKFAVSTSKKKSSGIVKQISVKDEKILNQAIEIANEISARSMNDLVSDQPCNTQSPKRKFSFRFTHLTNSGANEKCTSSSLNSTGGTGNSSQLKCSSPYSKKKNFTEELQSIPDIQRLRSLGEIKSFTNTDIRIPLFDKESSDFCFEKSREILSRPLTIDPPQLSTQIRDLETERIGIENPNNRGRDAKSISENIIDIENTLKALNLDFMHTYTELDKTDSDETMLNEKFSTIVSSIEDEVSNATGGLKSAVYNYGNGVQTMFDFNAATNHLDKHLQYINTQTYNQPISDSTQDQKLFEDKRSSTPDTGFASRDTNISLSRRSSQKSSHSPQDTYYSPKEVNCTAGSYSGFKDEPIFFPDIFATKYGITCASPMKSNISVYSTNRAKVDTDQLKNIGGGNRQRSMSFTDDINPISPVLSEPQQRLRRRSPSKSASSTQRTLDESHFSERSRSSSKPRSIRARTLRRLSYNPIILDTSSSSGGEESDCNRSIARSECDIRFRVSSLCRRRRQGLNRKVLSACQDDHESVIFQKKIYGSNASIKSAPHYNYRGNRNITRNYTKTHYDQYAYDDKIYDFGGRGPGNNYGVASSQNQTLIKPPQEFIGMCRGDIFHEFDVSRLTGKSPISNIGNSSSPEDQHYNGIVPHRPRSSPPSSLPLPILNVAAPASNPTNAAKSSQPQIEFHWPEQIHGSTVKQNDMIWLQQRPVEVYSNDNSSNDSDDLVFIPHIPPSPAP